MLIGSWEKDVVGMVEQKHGSNKILLSFDCETLKADKAAEDHIRQFMPKLAGLDAVGMLSLQLSHVTSKSSHVEHFIFF